MRTFLTAVAIAAGAATVALPAAPASAYCDTLTSAVTGGCSNPCTVTAHAYQTADERAKDLLPDVEFLCYA